jgi:hypothetical protein
MGEVGLTLLLAERWIRVICKQRASICFEFISEAAMEASNAASVNRRAFLSNPIFERSDRCTEENEIFWRVRETKDTKGFADSTYELLGTAKNALQRI